uniref:Uncharacterized protein n=1 Tax=Timema monikensis TaxID=170555 RepID=A0A7R9E4H7_9NEOP|nr:unnamed protein product [Timema monikensis]
MNNFQSPAGSVGNMSLFTTSLPPPWTSPLLLPLHHLSSSTLDQSSSLASSPPLFLHLGPVLFSCLFTTSLPPPWTSPLLLPLHHLYFLHLGPVRYHATQILEPTTLDGSDRPEEKHDFPILCDNELCGVWQPNSLRAVRNVPDCATGGSGRS